MKTKSILMLLSLFIIILLGYDFYEKKLKPQDVNLKTHGTLSNSNKENEGQSRQIIFNNVERDERVEFDEVLIHKNDVHLSAVEIEEKAEILAKSYSTFAGGLEDMLLKDPSQIDSNQRMQSVNEMRLSIERFHKSELISVAGSQIMLEMLDQWQSGVNLKEKYGLSDPTQ